MQQTMVAIYESRAEAERVRDQLLSEGLAGTNIRLSGESAEAPTTTTQHSPRTTSFFDWLFGAEPSATERGWYETNLSSGRTALSVYMDDAARQEQVREILEASDPLEIDEDAIASQAGEKEPGLGRSGAGSTSTQAAEVGDSEQVIPIEKEELQVGKRQTEVRHRIRTYVVERPVEEQVNLVDETVVVERRPADGVSTHSGAFQERDIETIERHEEPVVAKTVRTPEEVVVRKAKREHAETVRDSVRETKVDVKDNSQGTQSPRR
jgi:hypothetical protein